MDKNLIFLLIQIVVAVIFYIVGKYVPASKIDEVERALFLIAEWADKFVRYARQFLQCESGEDKMKYVVDELSKIAEQNKWNVTTEQITAIAQTAYDKMKNESN